MSTPVYTVYSIDGHPVLDTPSAGHYRGPESFLSRPHSPGTKKPESSWHHKLFCCLSIVGRNESSECERRWKEGSSESEGWSHCVANVLQVLTAENGNNGGKWQDNDQCFCPLNLSEVLRPNHIHSESFEGIVPKRNRWELGPADKRTPKGGIPIYHHDSRTLGQGFGSKENTEWMERIGEKSQRSLSPNAIGHARPSLAWGLWEEPLRFFVEFDL